MKFLRSILVKLHRPSTAPEVGPDFYDLLQQAHVHLTAQDVDQARPLLLKALQYRDHLAYQSALEYILMGLAGTWLLAERYDEGIAFFSDYITRFPTDSEGYHCRGENLWYAGRLQEAMRDYTQALELKPNSLLCLMGRGQVSAELGEHPNALHDLELALQKLDSEKISDSASALWYTQIEAFTRNGKGFALAGLGQISPAMEEFELSSRLVPDNAWVYYNRAQVHERLGNRKEAMNDYRKSLEKISPKLSPIKRTYAEARLAELSSSM